MTAQDMFLKLGFKLIKSDDSSLLYENRTELDLTFISFDIKTKSIYSELIDGKYGSPEPIILTFELFSAITQQVKELNW
mgnify:CR=1 FL=1